MKKHLFIFIIIVLFLNISFSGCEKKSIIIGTGEIKYIDLEGGFYGIIADDGTHYDPINLPITFQKNGLNVSYVLKIIEDQADYHMWGTIVKILHIKQLNTLPSGQLVNYSDCKESNYDHNSSMDCVTYQYDGESMLFLNHTNAGFNCCPEITANISINDSTILIDEIELSGLCDCLCLMDLSYEIKNLKPKEYTIEIREPYVQSDDEKLIFSVDLNIETTGIFCVERNRYPWGHG